jgi:hypothetical protein
MALSSSPFRSFLVRQTGMGCLQRIIIKSTKEEFNSTHFLASNHFEPSNGGSNGMTRSSAKNIPVSLRSNLRASKDLNFPFSFATPTTLEINLMPWDWRRSLYSRWGSLVIRQTALVRGSTMGCTIGLLTTYFYCSIFKNRMRNVHLVRFYFQLGMNFLYGHHKPNVRLLRR